MYQFGCVLIRQIEAHDLDAMGHHSLNKFQGDERLADAKDSKNGCVVSDERLDPHLRAGGCPQRHAVISSWKVAI